MNIKDNVCILPSPCPFIVSPRDLMWIVIILILLNLACDCLRRERCNWREWRIDHKCHVNWSNNQRWSTDIVSCDMWHTVVNGEWRYKHIG